MSRAAKLSNCSLNKFLGQYSLKKIFLVRDDLLQIEFPLWASWWHTHEEADKKESIPRMAQADKLADRKC